MSKKILLADDNKEFTGALSRILAGYDIYSAADGNAALAMIDKENPDLVLLDIEMPGISGLEVLKKIQEMSKKPLVIMLTADCSAETVTKAMAMGIFSYIIKPFTTEEVLEQVKRALAFREAAQRG